MLENIPRRKAKVTLQNIARGTVEAACRVSSAIWADGSVLRTKTDKDHP